MEGAIVVTCTENVAAVIPFGVAEACEGMQVDLNGAPVQLSTTAPWNPLIDATCRLKVAGLPARTVAVAEPPGARSIEKSVPVPVSPTDCGLLDTLSVNFNDAASAPVALGVNVTLTWHLLLTATVAPLQLLPLIAKSLAFGPLIITVLIVRAELPLFVTVTLMAELFTVFCCCPNEIVGTDGENPGGTTPVPVKPTLCVPAVSVMVSSALSVPTTDAVNLRNRK
jgi:hypothetical protein